MALETIENWESSFGNYPLRLINSSVRFPELSLGIGEIRVAGETSTSTFYKVDGFNIENCWPFFHLRGAAITNALPALLCADFTGSE